MARVGRDHARGAPRAELIWASPREVLNVVQADQVGCHIITMTHDLLRSSARSARTSSSSRSRPCRCSTATRSPPASRSSSDAARAASPAGPASSAATSPTGCSPTASRSWSTTTSAPAGVSSSPSAGAQRASCVEGDVLDARAARRRDRAAATRSSTCRPTPTCATGSSTRARPRAEHDRAPPNVLEAMRAAGVDDGSPSPRRARSTASPRSSRRPRTPRSRSRPRCTRRPSSPARG